MKKEKKWNRRILCGIFTLNLFSIAVFFSCSREDSYNDKNNEEEQIQKADESTDKNSEENRSSENDFLYWDNSQKAFIGNYVWKADNSMLLSTVKAVYFDIYDANNVFRPRISTDLSLDINTATLKITAKTTDAEIFKWADIPNTTVKINFWFIGAASEMTVKTQAGYKGPIQENIQFSIDEDGFLQNKTISIYGYKKDVLGINLLNNINRPRYYSVNDSGSGKKIGVKIKSIEFSIQGRSYSANIDWANTELLDYFNNLSTYDDLKFYYGDSSFHNFLTPVLPYTYFESCYDGTKFYKYIIHEYDEKAKSTDYEITNLDDPVVIKITATTGKTYTVKTTVKDFITSIRY